MKITRNNYETFFLLYADHELSDADKKDVEFFVEENADLQEEFSQILQLQLPAPHLQMDKTSLLKEEGHISTLEEKLLLYFDGEAGAEVKQEVETLLATDKEIAASYALLQKTQLSSSDSVLFEHKQLLYRQEPAKQISIKYLRWAAAAILLGIGLFAGIKIKNSGMLFNKQPQNELVQNTKISTPGKSHSNTTTAQSHTPNIGQQDSANVSQNISAVNPGALPGENLPGTIHQKTKSPNYKVALVTPATPEKTHHPEPGTQVQNIAKNPINKQPALPQPEEVAAQPEQEELTLAATHQPTKTIVDENITPLKEHFALATGFQEIPDESTANTILMMNENEVKQSKVGIFFRKLKRNIERRTNIKPGKKLKIANFEIAAN